MDGGIFKGNELIRNLTSKDFKTYTSFNSLLEGNDIKGSGLSVICPTINRPDYGEDFFGSCMELQEIDMSSSSVLFSCSSCINLETVFLPDNLSKYDIRRQFLGATKLKNLYIDKTNKNFATVNGVLYNKERTELIHYPAKSEAKLDENLKVIDAFAFYDFEGDVIKLPHGVETLITQSFMFKNIQKEIKVFLPETIEEISGSFISSETPIRFYCCTQSVKDRIETIKNEIDKILVDDIDINYELMTLDSLLASDSSLTMTEINNMLSGTDICR